MNYFGRYGILMVVSQAPQMLSRDAEVDPNRKDVPILKNGTTFPNQPHISALPRLSFLSFLPFQFSIISFLPSFFLSFFLSCFLL